MIRVQCAFVDTPEVERISKFIGSQPSYPTAFPLPEYTGEDGGKSEDNFDPSELDPMFEEAAQLIVAHQQGSTSLIQRKFSIGYNRAGRLMDQLERAGIVGPTQGSKPRDVYVLDEYQLRLKLDAMKT
jgi:S-DNA-T family DNA segregation ATPase FtsK/SpoIIIE